MALSTWKEVEKDVVVWSLGGVVFGAGLCLRIYSQMHLHHRLKIPKILTTTGPYAYIRNPLYVANTLLLTGVAFMSELLWFVPLMLVHCAIIYSFVARYEEARLTVKYGATYTEYFNQVPRWFPKLRHLQEKSSTKTLQFLVPSLFAEMHNLLLVIPFLIKEAFS